MLMKDVKQHIPKVLPQLLAPLLNHRWLAYCRGIFVWTRQGSHSLFLIGFVVGLGKASNNLRLITEDVS
jgi:hypothetical protein